MEFKRGFFFRKSEKYSWFVDRKIVITYGGDKKKLGKGCLDTSYRNLENYRTNLTVFNEFQ